MLHLTGMGRSATDVFVLSTLAGINANAETAHEPVKFTLYL